MSLLSWFRRTKEIVPFDGGMWNAMKTKDPALCERIGSMPVLDACIEWKSVHPEDFPWGWSAAIGPQNIRPEP